MGHEGETGAGPWRGGASGKSRDVIRRGYWEEHSEEGPERST